MKISIRLEDEYGSKGITKVTRELSWPEDSEAVAPGWTAPDTDRTLHERELEKRVVRQIAELAVDIHHTR